MKTTRTVALVAAVIAGAIAQAAHADGEVCSPGESKAAEAVISKAEKAEAAGRLDEAFRVATGSIPSNYCAVRGYDRRAGVIERTSKKLGTQAEKAGRLGDAFDYYIAPERHGRADYDLSDADRVMLAHARQRPDDYDVVFKALRHFEWRGISASQEAVKGFARLGGDRWLAKEEKTFSPREDSLEELGAARRLYELAGDTKKADARCEQRGDALLAGESIRSVERAFSYYELTENEKKLAAARARARSLGERAAGGGDFDLAAQFYALSGDQDRAEAVEEQGEKTEKQRRDQFEKEQSSLEEELGL